MSLTRLLLYSNQIDIEALIASTFTWQKTAVPPETMRALIDAYSQVRPRLLLHAVTIAGADTARASVTPTQTCRATWLPDQLRCSGTGTAHILLAVTDAGPPRSPLTAA